MTQYGTEQLGRASCMSIFGRDRTALGDSAIPAISPLVCLFLWVRCPPAMLYQINTYETSPHCLIYKLVLRCGVNRVPRGLLASATRLLVGNQGGARVMWHAVRRVKPPVRVCSLLIAHFGGGRDVPK